MIGESLRAALKLEGHAVDWVTDAQAAAATTATERFDLVLLDIGLPKGNGLDVLRGIRGRGDSTPVIVLTARDALGERVAGSKLRSSCVRRVVARPLWRRSTARMRASSSSSSNGLLR